MHRGDRRRILKQPPRWQREVIVTAPLSAVWNVVEDLSLIPDYHPAVRQVQFLTGQARRAAQVRYKCFLPEGGHWFVEEVVEHEPYDHTVLALVSDSRGSAERIAHFLTQISVEPRGSGETLLRLRAWYAPRGWLNRITNPLVLRRLVKSRAAGTLEGVKQLVERRQRTGFA